jgi:hypothetical protein
MTLGQYRTNVSTLRYRDSSGAVWNTLLLTALPFSRSGSFEPSVATPR